jgi:hypothetical protein
MGPAAQAPVLPIPEAGRSAEEIMKVTGRPIPTREEIKQRLLAQ